MKEDDLYSHFASKYRSVTEANIIKDSAKRSKRYGFVRFTDQAESMRAVEEQNGAVLAGRPMKVSMGKKQRDGNSSTP